MQEEIDKVTQHIPRERISERTVAHTVPGPKIQIQEEMVEVSQHVPRERISERTVTQIVNLPMCQFQEQIVKTGRSRSPFRRVSTSRS